jgi:hypothetical protein
VRHILITAGVLAGLWLYARRTLAFVDPRLINSCIIAAAAMLIGVAALHTRWAARIIAGGWLASLLVANALVNPVVPTEALFLRGRGHAVVDEAMQDVPGRLVDFTNRQGTILAGFGWPVLGHVAMAPDLALFDYLAPESPGLTEELYNRYAHVHFVLPPAETRLIFADAFQLATSPCSPRLETLGVNHFLAPNGAAIPGECSGSFTERPAADAKLWTRVHPVGRIGISSSVDASRAADFDFRAAVPEATLVTGRSSVTLGSPAGHSVAFAINRSVIDTVRCEGGNVVFADAHVIVRATANRASRCELRFLGTAGALRRLVLRETGPRVTLTAAPFSPEGGIAAAKEAH